METGGSLTAPDSVRKLQTALHAKAKGSPDFRFYSLSDKVWRADVLEAAWQTVRRNGGAAGVDGETVQRIETQGVERWLGELARDLKEGSYRPGAVRQVLIPKKQAGKYRALGIPCVRDRVAQTAALVVLAPIFEADLEPEQYAYREGCSAQDAVKRVHRLLNRGHREVVDADLSNYFGEIPHAELMRSVARRVSVVGDAGGRGRRQGWQTPHEPSGRWRAGCRGSFRRWFPERRRRTDWCERRRGCSGVRGRHGSHHETAGATRRNAPGGARWRLVRGAGGAVSGVAGRRARGTRRGDCPFRSW